MNFEFDPGKSASNLTKHGLSLADAQGLWNSPAVEVDLGLVHGEYRYARLAPFRGAIHLAVFTFRSSAVRLISARPATPQEAVIYEKNRKK